MTSTYQQKILDRLALGKARPSELDEACLGNVFMDFSDQLPPYAGDLQDLIDDGTVVWWEGDMGIIYYELAEENS